MGVALAAPAAFGDDESFAGGEEVHQEFPGVRVKDPGAQGYGNDQRGAAAAVAVLLAAGVALVGLKDTAAPEVG